MIDKRTCEHKHKVIVETPELQHYGKEVCSECGKFFKWVSAPNKFSIKEKCELIIPVLEKYAENSKSEFFKSIIRQWNQYGKLSPRQIECVVGNIGEELYKTYGEEVYNKIKE